VNDDVGSKSMKRIDSVPEMVRRPGQQCSFVGALEAVLKTHGEPHDYVDLMGLSGAAFRIRLARSSWDEIMGGRLHPGLSTDASFGPHADAVMEATGYGYRIVHHFAQGKTEVTETIREEIDAGRPLLALNLWNGSSWGVLCGYDETQPPTTDNGDGRAAWLLCRSSYDPPGADPGPPPQFPADVWSIGRKTSSQVRVAAVRASIRQAVRLFTTDKARANREGGWFWHYEPEYASGLAAYDAWIDDLEDEEGLALLPKDQSLMYWQGNAVMYAQLLDARAAAASYLARVAPSLPPNERDPVSRAAGVLGELVKATVADWDCAPFRRGGYVHENGWLLREGTQEFLGKPVPPYGDTWTSEMRNKTIAVLKSARGRDREALKLLQQAASSQPTGPADER